jgi:hypothetical protein
MLKSGNILRFTPTEIEEARLLGLDLSAVKNEEQFTSAVLALITTLERERPALLEKIAKSLAATTGRKLPAQVTVVK